MLTLFTSWNKVHRHTASPVCKHTGPRNEKEKKRRKLPVDPTRRGAAPRDAVHAVPDAVHAVPDAVHAVPDAVHAVPDAVHAVPDAVPAPRR